MDDFGPLTLDAGEVWVMGDNRLVGSSLDSRTYGPIRVQDVVGQAKMRLWPTPRALALTATK
ncbi:S26 family signal peptidase [Deinococcus radiophilus]|uniref:S26 family signal peptidase n=1 Tax=Deinococcus radiophilus TaxID=32062 RepID=UPI003616FF93